MSKAKIAVVNFETSGDKPANQEKMIDFINEYEYEAEDTNFCINPITFG